MESSKLRIESIECEIQGRCQRIHSISYNNETMLPGLLSKAQASSARVTTEGANVEHRLAEMGKKLLSIIKTRPKFRPLSRVENDLTNTISQGTSSGVLESMSVELEELARARYSDRIITEELTLEVLEIQERINSSMMTSTTEFANKKRESSRGENRYSESFAEVCRI